MFALKGEMSNVHTTGVRWIFARKFQIIAFPAGEGMMKGIRMTAHSIRKQLVWGNNRVVVKI